MHGHAERWHGRLHHQNPFAVTRSVSGVRPSGKVLDNQCVHVQLNTSTTDPTLQVAAIQQITTLVTNLLPVTQAAIAAITPLTVNTLGVQTLLQTALGGTGLYPLKASAAAFATCVTPYLPAGAYTGLGVALTSAPCPHQSTL